MSIESVAAIGNELSAQMGALTGVAPPASAFENLLVSIEGVNTQLLAGQKVTAQLASAPPESLHRSMLSLEQTRLSFELLLAVRNKALDAYQELMRMQV